MKRILTYILILITISAKGQTVNRFRDSSWFAKGVRFDSTLVFSKGAGNGKVWTSNANGTGTWQTFSNSGVSQGALNDSINAVRSIRKVDTLYRNLDSLVFKISGIRYAIKDSIGGGGGGSGVQSVVAGTNITVDNTDPNNPIISATDSTSSLFPNGIEGVNESRDFNSGDANKLLAIQSDDITLSMPSVNPFGKGDLVGIINTNEYKNTHIILKEGNKPILIGDEVFIFDLVDIGGGIYVPQPLTGIIYDENGENVKSIIRYLYDQSQNAIPLSGTTTGNPVTGGIEYIDLVEMSKVEDSNFKFFSKVDLNNAEVDFKLLTKSDNSYSDFQLNGSNARLQYYNLLLTRGTSVDVQDNNVTITASNTSNGLSGVADFTPNITDLDYTQKIYVDQRISDTATQIRSEIPDVSNFATITNLADTASSLHTLIDAKVSTTTLTDSLDKKTNKLISFNAYTTSDTLRLTDADKVIEMNVGSANNLVIPTNTAYAFPVGTQIVLIQIGAGQTTFVPASGVTVHSSGSKLKLTGQYSGATIIKKASNEWYLFGDITN